MEYKIIATLSTIPSRICFLKPVIDGMMSQSLPPDEIHLQIPKYSTKENCAYEIPDFFRNFDRLKIIYHDKDWGSATKWLPALIDNNQSKILLIIFDDDCLYPQDAIERLVAAHKRASNIVYCFSGGKLSGCLINKFCIANKPKLNALTIIKSTAKDIPVDTVQGFGMILLAPSIISKKVLVFLKLQALNTFSDDILLSSVLERQKIKRVQLAGQNIPTALGHAAINPIHGEGRLIKMTIKTFVWSKKHLEVWKSHKFVAKKPNKIKEIVKKSLLKIKALN